MTEPMPRGLIDSICEPSGNDWVERFGVDLALMFSVRTWPEAIAAWFWNTP